MPERVPQSESDCIRPEAVGHNERPVPAYRYMRGLNRDPTRNRQGHSYGREPEDAVHPDPERWRDNELYLHGVDLYHHSYFWEAHEAWEVLWRAAIDRHGPVARFLQALVLIAAAQVRVHAGAWRGARNLSRRAAKNLHLVIASGAPDDDGQFMGMQVVGLVWDARGYFAGLWGNIERREAGLRGRPPRLELEPRPRS